MAPLSPSAELMVDPQSGARGAIRDTGAPEAECYFWTVTVFEGLWICGRSALPTGCASPASRASSEGGEMLTFAHIPTGTTVNKAMQIDDSKSRGVAAAAAPTMIGADVETGGATP